MSPAELTVVPPARIAAIEVPYSTSDAISREDVAKRLRPGMEIEQAVKWVTEKIRRRNSNPLPVKNVGLGLLFSKIEIQKWLDGLDRPKRHLPPRKKKAAKKLAA